MRDKVADRKADKGKSKEALTTQPGKIEKGKAKSKETAMEKPEQEAGKQSVATEKK